MINISLIIPAAGIGKRFSPDKKKQYTLIDNKPLIYWTIKQLLLSYNFTELIIGLNEEDISLMDKIVRDLNVSIPYLYAEGGKERANTVLNCLSKATCDFVAVHDSVRPFVSRNVVQNTINEAIKYKSAICGLPVRDTIKKVKNNIVLSTMERDNLFLAYTPQVFDKEVIYYALNKAINDNILVTDESSACEYVGIKVATVLSNYENIKVTFAEDIDLINLFKTKFFGV